MSGECGASWKVSPCGVHISPSHTFRTAFSQGVRDNIWVKWSLSATSRILVSDTGGNYGDDETL